MTRKRSRPGSRIGMVFSRILLCAAVFIVLFALLSAAITPERYDIQIGQPAPNTIKATKDIEDITLTQERKAEAAASVKSIYIRDQEVQTQVMESADVYFKALRSLSAFTSPDGNQADITDTQLSLANEQLAPVEITSEELAALGATDEEEIEGLIALGEALLDEKLSGNLEENQIAGAIREIENALSARGASEETVSVFKKVISAVIRPNYFYDEKATDAQRRAEMEKIKTVTYIKGEVIVSDGEIVTAAQYSVLDALGIVKESGLDITLYYGVAILVILLVTAVVLYIALFDPEILKSNKALLLLSLISVIVVGVCVLVRDISPYFMPATLGILLVSQLVKRRLAIVMNVVLSVAVSLFASASTGFFNMTMFTIVVNSIVGGMVGLLVLKKKQQRTTTLLAGVAVGLSNMVCTLAIGLVNNSNLMKVLVMAEWSAGSGILAAILCIALMPILEGAFNIVTPNKLLELSNPNQPLLRRLLLEAPGTYHHSIIVANLAEAAAGEIGANGLLARVGAYYHDVGKLKRPSYFKENQMGDNPHDRTDPRVSTAILTAHTRDGVQMLQRERIPEPIIDIVSSHHGDTPVLYFYNKSRMENGDDVKIDDFRYDGPRPRSKEAAIVMLADTVEAAARSMPNPDSEKLNALIRNLVRQKMEDGQLDYCELTFGNVDKICASFLTVLSGVFHERIEYPSIEIPRKKIKALTGENADAGPAAASEAKPEAAPASEAKSEPAPASEAKSEPAPASEVKPAAAPAAEAKPEPAPASEAKPESAPAAEAKPAAAPSAEAKPEPAPASEGKQEAAPASEGNLKSEAIDSASDEAAQPSPEDENARNA